MLTKRQLFLQHIAQTSPEPLMLEIERAEGVYLYDTNNKAYLDLIAGISVSNIGHCHPKVVAAIQKQAAQYMHLMVYGEYIYTPQVALTTLLCQHLPSHLNAVYLVNSGTEATEGALKLAKRYTKRTELISFSNAYHGSTHGSLSIMGSETFKQAFRPLLPDTRHIPYNSEKDLTHITEKTACVMAEVVQAEAGVIVPQNDFLKKLRKRCTEVGALLIFDEIQTGFGRTGSLFAFEQYGIEPDILLLAKGMGGGLPIGAFIASREIMTVFQQNPVLGHITTFGGNPVTCAASLATLKVLLENDYIAQVKEKEALFHKHLKHEKIRAIRSKGLLMAVEFKDFDFTKKVIDKCIEKGLITDWFLFADNCLRIAPPLIIDKKQIVWACEQILRSIDEIA
ncbi:MAG: aspartate aminotransferase family protein [Chitinophagales bacterium]